MPGRHYKLLVARDEAGLRALVTDGWTLLQSTLREFESLETDDDLALGEIGRVEVAGPGFVALAWR
jgi:hypothetical protein